METISTEIPRMFGDHHITAIHQTLAELTGIHDIRANASSHRLSVDFDPEVISAEAILAQLAERGYPPVNGHPHARSEAGQKDPAWGELALRMTQTNPADR